MNYDCATYDAKPGARNSFHWHKKTFISLTCGEREQMQQYNVGRNNILLSSNGNSNRQQLVTTVARVSSAFRARCGESACRWAQRGAQLSSRNHLTQTPRQHGRQHREEKRCLLTTGKDWHCAQRPGKRQQQDLLLLPVFYIERSLKLDRRHCHHLDGTCKTHPAVMATNPVKITEFPGFQWAN